MESGLKNLLTAIEETRLHHYSGGKLITSFFKIFSGYVCINLTTYFPLDRGNVVSVIKQQKMARKRAVSLLKRSNLMQNKGDTHYDFI